MPNVQNGQSAREKLEDGLALHLFERIYFRLNHEEKTFVDGLVLEVERLREVPLQRVDAALAARVTAHRQAQARFSVAIPASLEGAVTRAVEAVVDAHHRSRIPANQYSTATGDVVVTVSALDTLPASLLRPVEGA